ncbi:MAG TPA: hypothetical protein VHB69_09845 [Mycobacteriales bacterium]|nr:hypothetical protein [Mycobacteriales bacterium]
MDQCTGCGATLPPAATWCTQCFAVIGPTASAPAPTVLPGAVAPARAAGDAGYSIMSGDRQQAAARPPTPMVKTRWRKTPTTFGPVGRLVCTFLLIVPVPLLVVGVVVSGGLEIVGAGIWILVIMPWALRDIWKAGQLPAG